MSPVQCEQLDTLDIRKPANVTSANAGFFIGGRLLKNGGELPHRSVNQGLSTSPISDTTNYCMLTFVFLQTGFSIVRNHRLHRRLPILVVVGITIPGSVSFG
jgi:hypothetical protein